VAPVPGLFLIALLVAQDALPAGFVDLAAVAPGVLVNMRYFGKENFVGRPVHGYQAPRCLLSRKAALALAAAESELEQQGLALMVYDCYRPQRAVNDFVAWSHDLRDTATKSFHYPAVAKSVLFASGYIASRSAHSRGSTVDLTLVRMPRRDGYTATDCRSLRGTIAPDGTVDMGTTWDCFDERSHTAHPGVSERAHRNRLFLRDLMVRHGFVPYAKEWWHFTLADELFPDTYFDFPVR
jgi:D-alanyl-D-alanine dipeptidase